MHEKCDMCQNWTLQCELNGDFRRGCRNKDYIFYVKIKPKKTTNKRC